MSEDNLFTCVFVSLSTFYSDERGHLNFFRIKTGAFAYIDRNMQKIQERLRSEW